MKQIKKDKKIQKKKQKELKIKKEKEKYFAFYDDVKHYTNGKEDW